MIVVVAGGSSLPVASRLAKREVAKPPERGGPPRRRPMDISFAKCSDFMLATKFNGLYPQ